MQKTIKISIVSLLSLITAIAMVMAIQLTHVSAHTEGDQKHKDEHTKENKTANSTNDSYVYKAQAGDSYSQIARKAVQTYGIDNKVNLSQAGIVFAETQITNEAKAGELNVGQEVKISKVVVKKQVEAAQKLTKVQQKSWGYYVQFIDFNTNKVGQA